MPAGNGGMDSKLHKLYAQAEATRRQSRVLAAQHRAAQHNTAEILQLIHAAQDRAEQIHELWLTNSANRLRYSAYARLQARLASMPVIEQAKGIIMAQCGWPEDRAFDALRRVSQRENVKIRDLATQIVAKTARSAAAQPQAGSARAAAPARDELAHAQPRAALAGATAHGHGDDHVLRSTGDSSTDSNAATHPADAAHGDIRNHGALAHGCATHS